MKNVISALRSPAPMLAAVIALVSVPAGAGIENPAVATPVPAAQGGTGVNNGANTLTLGGAFSTGGPLAFTHANPASAYLGITVPVNGTTGTDNVFELRNNSVYSNGNCGNAAFRAVDSAGNEHAAFGYTNSPSAGCTGGAFAQDYAFIEVSDLGSTGQPTNFALLNTNNPAAQYIPYNYDGSANIHTWRSKAGAIVATLAPEIPGLRIGDGTAPTSLGDMVAIKKPSAVDSNLLDLLSEDNNPVFQFLSSSGHNATFSQYFAGTKVNVIDGFWGTAIDPLNYAGSGGLDLGTAPTGAQNNGGYGIRVAASGTGTIRLGGADAAAPAAQSISTLGVAAGTSNTAGANTTISAGQGTGTGAGGSLIFQVAPAASTGTAQNALASALTLDGTKLATFGGGIQAAALATSGTIAGSICRTAGGVILYESGASGCTISLEELKQDIAAIPFATAFREAMALDPISYAMKAADPQGPRFGFGARQVNAVDARLGVVDGAGDLQSYDPNGVLAVTVRLLQAVQLQVLGLWALVIGLAIGVWRLWRRLRRVEAALARLTAMPG